MFVGCDELRYLDLDPGLFPKFSFQTSLKRPLVLNFTTIVPFPLYPFTLHLF